jgi:ubiquinone biosynthesis protein COQ9
MPEHALPADPTLDEVRAALAPVIGRHAGFDGWSDAAVHAAAYDMSIDRDVAMLAFNGKAIDMIDAWIEGVDLELARRLPADKLGAMKIRDRITALLATRLEIMAPDRESLRRALAIMAMPQNLARSAKMGWRSADRMWRLAGDAATDLNHYTKRMTLSAVYASTLSVFVNDDSDNFADTLSLIHI